IVFLGRNVAEMLGLLRANTVTSHPHPRPRHFHDVGHDGRDQRTELAGQLACMRTSLYDCILKGAVIIDHSHVQPLENGQKRTLAFLDGENLTCRYQDIVTNGRQPRKEVVHHPDSFVWHPGMTTWSYLDVIRVAYYTSIVGDEVALADLETKISKTIFTCTT